MGTSKQVTNRSIDPLHSPELQMGQANPPTTGSQPLAAILMQLPGTSHLNDSDEGGCPTTGLWFELPQKYPSRALNSAGDIGGNFKIKRCALCGHCLRAARGFYCRSGYFWNFFKAIPLVMC